VTQPAELRAERGKQITLRLIAAALALVCSLLGVWQVERLRWKTDLIARVEARVHAPATPAPGPARWSSLTRADDEYRRITARGVFEPDKETLVQAVTVLGPGYWVMTPLRTDAGVEILVNRGFVPTELKAPAARPASEIAGPVAVTGLLRFSEPGGGFLRANRPASGLWYSRDVAAIAAAQRLATTAPYFIDADATPNPTSVMGGWPRGGLTVVRFRNDHLAYALTWFGLALLAAGFALLPAIAARRLRTGD
jgi:surfeit locus 1 family protein